MGDAILYLAAPLPARRLEYDSTPPQTPPPAAVGIRVGAASTASQRTPDHRYSIHTRCTGASPDSRNSRTTALGGGVLGVLGAALGGAPWAIPS